MGRFRPLEFRPSLPVSAIAEKEVDQVLVGHAKLSSHLLEIVDRIVIEPDG